ncbi:MAG: hypothetical protein ABL878_02110 [Burkholderiales bacterium]
MSYADLIAKEIETLSPEKQARVLNFVAVLKGEQGVAGLPKLSKEQESRRDELVAFFSSYTADLTGYRFDREHANARR